MAHLFKPQDYARFLGARDLRGIIDYLLGTDYSKLLSLVPTSQPTPMELEIIIYEKLSQRWFSLLSMSSGGTRELLEAHNTQLEVENLKKIIGMVHGKETAAPELLINVPRKYQNANLHALSTAKSMIEVADLLRETPYHDIGNWLGEYTTYNNPLILEAQLDKIYFTNFFAKARKSPDRAGIMELMGTAADIRNLQLILSAKYMKLEPQIIQMMIIPFGHRLLRSVAARIAAIDIQAMASEATWPSYSELLRSAVKLLNEGRLADMEILFLQHLYAHARKLAVRNPNKLAYVFSYLSLCMREAKNLSALAFGKQMKIPQESLRTLLS